MAGDKKHTKSSIGSRAVAVLIDIVLATSNNEEKVVKVVGYSQELTSICWMHSRKPDSSPDVFIMKLEVPDPYCPNYVCNCARTC